LTDLISVDDALSRILNSFSTKPEEYTHLLESYHRIVSRDITALSDLPPFTNSSMDGFAVIAEDLMNPSPTSPVKLIVDYDIAAGSDPKSQILPGHAARIMTGAPLPPGANAVVPVENTDSLRHDLSVSFPSTVNVFSSVGAGENVRPQGMDISKGQPIIRKSTRLRPQEISALAALGIFDVPVFQHPKVAVLSTGDELIPPEGALLPGKIHESNSYSLIGLARDLGCEVINLGIAPDNRLEIQNQLDKCVSQGIDLIISSAGVSIGAYDYVKEVIESKGRIEFWRVNMRPGKPVAFGDYRSIPIIGLAGNPVSAFVGFLVFIRPVILKISGIEKLDPEFIPMRIDVAVSSDGRQSYLRATAFLKDGEWIAHPAGHQGSGNVLSMVNSNALLIIPPGVKSLPANSRVQTWLLS
jgi:molybdopterin molybdotransferase